MNKDPASLSNLNDIVLIASPSWWPLAAGWYALMGGLLFILGWRAYQSWKGYRSNRYRRAALRELLAIESDIDAPAHKNLPALLKRTAMQAFSREQIAALSGIAWQDFLNRQCPGNLFDGEAGEQLLLLAYRPDAMSSSELGPLIKSIRLWIQQHQAEPC